MKQHKVAVLIHGCHLEAEGWENIVWGALEKGKLGRIPRGIAVAITHDAEFIVWGSGASERDGLKESEYTFQYALNRVALLGGYFSDNDIAQRLKSLSVLDTESQNTKDEIRAMVRVSREKGITKIILVSSPTHISRCLLEAEVVRAEGVVGDIEIFATASDTCYGGTSPRDVFIIEPPHRGDRPKVFLNKTLQDINKIRKNFDIAEPFNEALKVLVEEWKKKI